MTDCSANPARARRAGRLRQTFGRPRYRRAWTLSTIPHLGYWLVVVTFQWIVTEQTAGDPVALGWLYFVMLVPFLVVSLPAGTWADRFDRTRILALTQTTIALTSAVTAVVVHLGLATPLTLMIAGAVFGTALAGGQPAAHALVAESVPPTALRDAVTFQGLGVTFSRFLGPALGGACIALLGPGATLALHSALTAVVAVLALTDGHRSRGASRRGGTEGVLGRVREGLVHARSRPAVRSGLATVALVSLLGSSYLAQTPATASLVSPDQRWFVVLMSATGVGAVIGVSLVAVRLSPAREVRLTAACLVLLAAALATMGWGRAPGLQLVAFTVASACQFAVLTMSVRLIQVSIDDSHRGRVMSLHQLCYGGLIPVGGLLLGGLWQLTGPRAAFTTLCVVIVGYASWLWFTSPRLPAPTEAAPSNRFRSID